MADEAKVVTVSARITGRCLVQTPPGSGPAPVLVGFHGYGENAERHLRELGRLPGAEAWLLVSVQALHQFYERRSGAVVASWMTSQDREQMIADNVAYVDSVVTTVTPERTADSPLVYCGFSQGVAMAYRAALRGRHRANGVIALAGDVPPELCAGDDARWPHVLVGRGAADSFYTQEAMDQDVAVLEARGALFEAVVFDGRHEWHDDFRAAAGRLLRCAQG